jgi:hypothetical protein
MVDLPAPEGPDMTIARVEVVGAIVEGVVYARRDGALDTARRKDEGLDRQECVKQK